MLDQVKDVALGLAERIPPPSAIVVDDQDLALLRGDISKRAACSGACRASSHSSCAQARRRNLRWLATTAVRRRRTWRGAPGGGLEGLGCAGHPLSFASPSRPGDREAGGVQGRRLVRRPRSGFPCGPQGASGSGLIVFASRHPLFWGKVANGGGGGRSGSNCAYCMIGAAYEVSA